MTGQWLHVMDDEGHTPLDRAFDSGHMALAELMLQQEKDDMPEALHDCTPLHRAASLGLTEAVMSLLTYGADPMAHDTAGETPLHKAVREDRLEAAEALVSVSNVNTASNNGMTPLHWACIGGNIEMAECLLNHGADPNLQNDFMDGMSPADIAESMDYDELSAFLSSRETFV